jgi:hypothetical protein
MPLPHVHIAGHVSLPGSAAETARFLSPQGARVWVLSKREARMIVRERKARTGSLHCPPRQFVSPSAEGSRFVSGGFYTHSLFSIGFAVLDELAIERAAIDPQEVSGIFFLALTPLQCQEDIFPLQIDERSPTQKGCL